MVDDNIKRLANSTIGKAVAVNTFGSDKLKKHYNDYNTIRSSTMEDALIKTLDQYYSSVQRVKVDRTYRYKLGEAYEVPQKRVDRRTTNSGMRKKRFVRLLR